MTTDTAPDPILDDLPDDLDDDEEHRPDPNDPDLVLRGELVPSTSDDDEEPAVYAAIEAAAKAALDQPGLPGRDEFLALAMMARMIAGSNLAPAAIRGNPADAMVLLLTARDLGIPLTSAMRKVYVIDGQPSIAPQLECALIRRQGLGAVVPHQGNHEATEWAGAVAVGPDGRPMGPPVFFTWDDAVTAGLVLAECRPGDHSDRCRENQPKKDVRVGVGKCKANWLNYPRDLMWARASGRCARQYFPEAALGLYSADELGAVTDETGAPIDPSTVALPEGYEDAERRTGGSAAQQAAKAAAAAEAAAPADPEVIAELVVRARALPDEQRAMLNTKWRENERLAPHRPESLPRSLVAFVESMLTGFERLAERRDGGWDGDAARAEVRAQMGGEAATSGEGPSDGDPAPDTPEPDSDAADGDTAADPGDVGEDE